MRRIFERVKTLALSLTFFSGQMEERRETHENSAVFRVVAVSESVAKKAIRLILTYNQYAINVSWAIYASPH